MSHKRNAPSHPAGHLESGVPPGKKQKREYTDVDRKLAENFERLGEEIEEERISAAIEIVNLYKTSNELSEKILVRLIKGLCSSRKAARPGFFIAFAEVLKATKDNPAVLKQSSKDAVLQFVFEKVKSVTKAEGVASSQEKRDYFLGRITAFSAIIHSEALIGQDTTSSLLDSLFQEVWQISQKSTQYSEQCGKVYFDAVSSAISNADQNAVERTLKFLEQKNLFKTAEGIAIWLKVSQSAMKKHLQKHVWHHKDPLSKREHSTIAQVMKGAGDSIDLNGDNNSKNAQGSRRAAPHFAWQTIFEQYFRSDELDKEKGSSGNFESLWNTIVDDVYFAPTASPERKALGFHIFSIILSTGPVWACEQALSRKFTQCLLTQSKKDARFLHKAATTLLRNLKSRAALHRSLALAFLRMMLMRGPEKDPKPDAEKITRNRSIVNELFKEGSEDVAESIMTLFQQILLQPRVETEKEGEVVRKAVADHMISLARARKQASLESGESNVAWKRTLLHTLVRASCLQPSSINDFLGPCAPSISKQSQEMLKSKLLSCLRELLDPRTSAGIEILASQLEELWDCGSHRIEEIRENQKAITAFSEGLKVLKEIQEKEQDSERDLALLRTFKLLFSMTMVQICCGDSEAVSILNDLLISHGSLRSQNDSDCGEYDPIVQIILGYCSNPSAVYRSVSEQMFEGLVSNISPFGLEAMTYILEQEENLAGQQALYRQLQEDDELSEINGTGEADHDSKSGSEDSDVEIMDAEADGVSVESSQGENNSSSSDEEDYNSGDEALNESLGKILQTGNLQPETADMGEQSSSDESMDDAQMEALGIDEKLSAIFAQQKVESQTKGKTSNQKREQKNARLSVVNFKTRVLDLLTIYVKQHHASEFTLEIISPLLRLIRKTRTAHLAKKASEVLEIYFNTAKSKGMPLGNTNEILWPTMKAVHDEVLEFASKMHTAACSRSSLFLARIHVVGAKNKSEGLDFIIDVYATTHKRKFIQNSGTPASFWTDFVNWSMDIGGEK